MLFKKTLEIPDTSMALPGRDTAVDAGRDHFVNGNPLKGPYPDGHDIIYFALGCYWGAEKTFWQLNGVWVTAVGNIAGSTPNPTYKELCSGQTGHAEAVLVVYDPKKITITSLLETFWQSHNPTQGMRQGNDQGTQYRSGIYWTTKNQCKAAQSSRDRYQSALIKQNFGTITTEVHEATEFYFAEEYHQQYLAKNPNGYCGIGGLGIEVPNAS